MASSLLRICTAGHVDDGKSTLIGRLLHDSRAVYDDHVRAVTAASRGRTAGPIDFSLFTDGLKAEREQGITIDVAYRYFATARRSFILADTPGHEQYTRNMATGASTADVAVLVVDARHGMREQSLRHVRIARLMGIRSFVLAVNKMDLVGHEEAAFEAVRRQFLPALDGAALQAVPISALDGDNIVDRSPRTPWYAGPALLEHLERVNVEEAAGDAPFRLAVQMVLRGGDGVRAYAGRVASGAVGVGDRIGVWPSGTASSVSRITTFDGDLECASAGMSVALVLAGDLDVSRGDVLAAEPPLVAGNFRAAVVWMDERPLESRRLYALEQGTRRVWAEVDRPLALNEVGDVVVTTSRPLAFDSYAVNRHTGSFILIDPDTNFTAGAGMIVEGLADGPGGAAGIRAAAHLASIARHAASDADAAERVHRALEELLA